MLIGAVCGIAVRYAGFSVYTVHSIIRFVKPVGDVFLRMIFMMIMPLLVSALSLGVAEIGDIRKIGKVGLRTLAYTVAVSTLAVMLGIALVTVFEPGSHFSEEKRQLLLSKYSGPAGNTERNRMPSGTTNILDALVKLVPRNPLEDMTRAFDPDYAGGGILAVIFFSLMMGIALSLADREKTRTFRRTLEGLYEVVMQVIAIVMKLAPFGVASLLFCLTATMGFSILLILSRYVLVVLVGLAVHQFIVYSLLLKYAGKMNPWFFFKNMREVMLVAFSTSSSNATLPTTLRTATEKLNLPSDISRFVLTVGSTANQNGTALYEGVTVLFLAQCFGLHLAFSQQVFVVLLAVLAGVGTAGVPGGSLPAMVMILTGIGLPAESIGIILGVDRFLDMSRTVLNVTGDMTVAVYVSRFEENPKVKGRRKNQ
jgi:DAACS family dicarboxylate/amino acid:cation (Na+ or H+) symporter